MGVVVVGVFEASMASSADLLKVPPHPALPITMPMLKQFAPRSMVDMVAERIGVAEGGS